MSTLTYSIYDAKAKLSEIIRYVKKNKHIVITERGQKVAEVIPYDKEKEDTLEERIARFTREGLLVPAASSPRTIDKMKPLAHRPGALKRFLASRD